jgi:hypothetical protein
LPVAWDRRFLDDLCRGTWSNWTGLSERDGAAEAGNGGLEIIHWLFMATAVQAASAEVVYYEPLVQWMTGMGGIEAFNRGGN